MALFSRARFTDLGRNLHLHFSRKALWAGLGVWVCLLGLIGLFPKSSNWIDRGLFDGVENLLSWVRAPHADICVVGIDDPSLRETGLAWPWSRGKQAELLKAVQAQNPRLVVWDILLQHPENTDGGRGDRLLADQMRQCGSICLISILEYLETDMGLEIQHYASAECFRQAARMEGFVRGLVDPDQVIRSFACADENLGVESCVQAVARLRNPAVALPALRTNGISASMVLFARAGGGMPIFGGSEILNGRLASGALRDKIVLIGVTAREVGDSHVTPLGQMPGTVLLAHTLDTLLSGRVLEPPGRIGLVLGFTLLGALLSAMNLARMWSRPWLDLIVPAAGFVMGFLIIGRWLGWCLPLGAFILAWWWAAVPLMGLEWLFGFLQHQYVERETAIVGNIQRKFFPEKPLILPGGFECYGLNLPCEKAGGDYYDFFEVPGKGGFFALGDVTGHGFAAGMITAMAKGLVTWLDVNQCLDLGAVAEHINYTLLETFKRRKLMTFVTGFVNVAEEKIELRSYGHLPEYHLDENGNLTEHGYPSFPIGGIKRLVHPTIKTVDIPMKPGDALVFYTDGVTEAVDWTDEQYGFTNWQECIKRHGKAPLVPDFFAGVMRDLRTFTGDRPFNDDVTLMMIRRVKT